MTTRSPQPLVAFHVGAHKTGTSLVQKYVANHADALRAHRIGKVKRSELAGLIRWGAGVIDDPRPLAAKIAAAAKDTGVDALVLSNENTLGKPLVPGGKHLYPKAPAVIESLEALLRPFRSKILLSVRPVDEFLESYYLQLIHQGEHDPFATWFDTLDLEALSWRPIVDALVDAFGAERVAVLDFRKIREGQQSYLRYFFTSIDPAFDFDIEEESIRNPSISEKGLQMALAANPYLHRGTHGVMRRFLQEHFSNVDYPRPVLLSDEQKAWLRERYGDEYEALVATGTPDLAR